MKRKLFKILCIFIILVLSNISYADDYIEEDEFEFDVEETIQASTDTNDVNLNSRIAVAYDRDSGRVIWGKNENKKTAMASTTNPMATQTILLFLRNIGAILK